jgi:hypothetical protein
MENVDRLLGPSVRGPTVPGAVRRGNRRQDVRFRFIRADNQLRVAGAAPTKISLYMYQPNATEVGFIVMRRTKNPINFKSGIPSDQAYPRDWHTVDVETVVITTEPTVPLVSTGHANAPPLGGRVWQMR